MRVDHWVCDGCNECFGDNFTEYEEHIKDCLWYKETINEIGN